MKNNTNNESSLIFWFINAFICLLRTFADSIWKYSKFSSEVPSYDDGKNYAIFI